MALPATIRQVTAGDHFTCLLDDTGKVYCLGDNYYRQIGNGGGNPSVWTQVPLFRTATKISAGDDTSCALLDDHTVSCWGDNGSGQLGDATTNPRSTPGVVSGVTGAIDVATGGDHACALISGGGVRCWGADSIGQLGDGDQSGPQTPKAPVTALATGAVELVSGGAHSCIRDGAGQVWCWGRDFQNELGDGNDTNSASPVKVAIGTAIEIAARSATTCAILQDASLWCWGSDQSGQIGDHMTAYGDPPTASPLVGVRAVAIGDSHLCALRTDGTIGCLGDDSQGQLGDGVVVDAKTAQQSLITDGAMIEAGFDHACVARTGGAMSCWGSGTWGQLGDGTEPTYESTPSDVTGVTSPTGFALGLASTCSLAAGGIACWGQGFSGQLGDNMYDYRDAPFALGAPLDANVTSVTHGGFFACATKNDQSLWCWGENGLGQLGDGTMTNAPTPIQITRLPGVVEVTAGWHHTCGRTSGAVYCWGENGHGELGGNPGAPTDMVQVPIDATTVVQLALGNAFSCARTTTEVDCWGMDDDGELGDGGGPSTSTPITVQLGAVAKDVAAGGFHACAIRASDGAVFCWGANDRGQLGDGTFSGNVLPQPVGGLPGPASRLAVGDSFSCALLADASVWCWGSNGVGELALGTALTAFDPVTTGWTCP
jgi:alpha-tubulin suppressor-like RCC1 family protein